MYLNHMSLNNSVLEDGEKSQQTIKMNIGGGYSLHDYLARIFLLFYSSELVGTLRYGYS